MTSLENFKKKAWPFLLAAYIHCNDMQIEVHPLHTQLLSRCYILNSEFKSLQLCWWKLNELCVNRRVSAKDFFLHFFNFGFEFLRRFMAISVTSLHPFLQPHCPCPRCTGTCENRENIICSFTNLNGQNWTLIFIQSFLWFITIYAMDRGGYLRAGHWRRFPRQTWFRMNSWSQDPCATQCTTKPGLTWCQKGR